MAKEPEIEKEVVEPEVVEPVVEPTPEKTFTQTEVNAMNMKSKSKYLKGLGFENEEDYKEALQKKKDNLSADEKIKAMEATSNEALSRADKAEAKLTAIELGVPTARLEKVLKLAQTYDGDDMNAKINEVLKEFPEFKAASGVPKFGNDLGGGKGGETKEEMLKKIFKASLTKH